MSQLGVIQAKFARCKGNGLEKIFKVQVAVNRIGCRTWHSMGGLAREESTIRGMWWLHTTLIVAQWVVMPGVGTVRTTVPCEPRNPSLLLCSELHMPREVTNSTPVSLMAESEFSFSTFCPLGWSGGTGRGRTRDIVYALQLVRSCWSWLLTVHRCPLATAAIFSPSK